MGSLRRSLRRLRAWGARTAFWLFVVSPLVALALLVVAGTLIAPRLFCQPAILGLPLPSEKAIPAPVRAQASTASDIQLRFRYHPTGTEANAGVPYWIWRALPVMFPEKVNDQGYAYFGLLDADGHDYQSRAGLPRGMSLSDSVMHFPGFQAGLGLERVAFNCAGCHQGEYIGPDGKRHFVDGMPNHIADTQGYKRFIKECFADPRFTPEKVIETIDDLLEQQGSPPLTATERTIYGIIVRAAARTGQYGDSWMDRRPDNGPGRIDAFNAVKYEVLGVPDDGEPLVGTVDLPPIWNMGKHIRRYHHADGNTADSRARNYGSIVGVGGNALSIRGASVDAIGAWLEVVPPPAFPFARPAGDVLVGERVYLGQCAHCHGVYDPVRRTIREVRHPELGSNYQKRVDVGTDDDRRRAFDDATARALNEFGSREGIWPVDSFHASHNGYLVPPLDGIWARAPYLHNGSVPTLWDLLSAAPRPERFYRGHRRYDPVKMGWVHDQPRDEERALFLYDTTLRGNGNQGHEVIVSEEDLPHLLAYLSTL